MEESVRFSISQPEAALEWLWISTVGDSGNVHIGPNARFGVVGVTHEQHCLRAIRHTLDAVDVPLSGHALHHSEHCLSFLREHTLCAADITLEPAFSTHNVDGRTTKAAYGTGVTHQCRDWVQAREFAEKNYLTWKDEDHYAVTEASAIDDAV